MKPSQKKATLLALAVAMGAISIQSNAALDVNVSVSRSTVEIHDYFKQKIEAKYHAKTNDQIILPLDIADIVIQEGTLINKQKALPSLFQSKSKTLEQYLDQNKHAGDLFNKYQLRINALNQGKVPQSITVEQALNQEALFKFLNVVVTPSTITPELIQYLESRGLNQKEIAALQKWGQRFVESPELPLSISSAIATEFNNSYNEK